MALRYMIIDHVWWRWDMILVKWVWITAQILKCRHHAHNLAVTLIKPNCNDDCGLKCLPFTTMRMMKMMNAKSKEFSGQKYLLGTSQLDMIFVARFGDLVLQKRWGARHLDIWRALNKRRISESWSFEQTDDEWDPANKHIPQSFVCMRAGPLLTRLLLQRFLFSCASSSSNYTGQSVTGS